MVGFLDRMVSYWRGVRHLFGIYASDSYFQEQLTIGCLVRPIFRLPEACPGQAHHCALVVAAAVAIWKRHEQVFAQYSVLKRLLGSTKQNISKIASPERCFLNDRPWYSVTIGTDDTRGNLKFASALLLAAAIASGSFGLASENARITHDGNPADLNRPRPSIYTERGIEGSKRQHP